MHPNYLKDCLKKANLTLTQLLLLWLDCTALTKQSESFMENKQALSTVVKAFLSNL